MKFKKIISSILLVATISTTPVFAQVNSETLNIISSENEKIVSNGYEISNQFKVLVNKSEVTLKNGTLVFNGRTYLPIRELSTFLNANIDYNAENKVSILSKNNTTIEVPQNRTKATVIKDNIANVLNMDTDSNIQSLVLDGVTYLPLRFIAENLGYDIVYSAENKTIELNEKNTNNIIATETNSETTTFATTTEKPTETTTYTTTTKENVIIYTQQTPYVGNRNNFMLHYSDCRAAKKLLPEHRMPFETKEDGISAGYTDLCGICFK